MAAFAGESSNKVWERVKQYLGAFDTNPGIASELKALKMRLATQGGNPTLQFLPFSEADCDAAGGTVLGSGAAKLHAVFIRKETGSGASATDNFFWLYDDATDDTTDANGRLMLPLLISAEDQQCWIHPVGLPLATGIVVTQYTGPINKSDGSNGGSGFCIIAV